LWCGGGGNGSDIRGLVLGILEFQSFGLCAALCFRGRRRRWLWFGIGLLNLILEFEDGFWMRVFTQWFDVLPVV
jgi:hypothetical protein